MGYQAVRGSIDSCEHDVRVHGRGVHHWASSGRSPSCRWRLFLACVDAGNPLFWCRNDDSDLSRHSADFANVANRSLAHLCSAYGSRRRGLRWVDHAPEDNANYRFRLAHQHEAAGWRKRRALELAHRGRPAALGDCGRVGAADYHDVGIPHVQARSWRADFALRQYRRLHLCRHFWIPVRYRLFAYYRPDWQFGKSCFRNDDCDSHGHIGNIPGIGMDGSRLWRSGADDWWSGLHRVIECRRYFTRLENRLSDWRDPQMATGSLADRSNDLNFRRGLHADWNEQRS